MNQEEKQTTESNLSPALKSAMEALLNAKVKDIVAFTQELAKEAGIDLNALATASSGAAAPQEQAEEKTEFTVTLSEVGANKIAVIKIIKDITGLGLMEAKNFVESAPQVIKQEVKKDEADKIKQDVEATGAKVTIA